MTEKRNPDYSASAVNLTNSSQVMDLLAKYHAEERVLSNLRQQAIDAVPKELQELIALHTRTQFDIDKVLRQSIDEHGSFQNVDAGQYAIRQRRESIIYKPELVRCYAPSKVASFVLIESVDKNAMDAMIKTGQITPEVAKQCGEVKESFAYIIK